MKRLELVKLMVTAAGILTVSGVAMAQMGQERGNQWGWGMNPMGGGYSGVGGIGMFLVWGLAIVGVVLGIRWLVTQGKK
jgi:uncharacterized membrane protein